VRALRDVTLSIGDGQSVGLVGESGCGKSTLARIVVGLERPSMGSLTLTSVPYPTKTAEMRRLVSSKVQMVFQDPRASLNPRKSGLELLRAPLEALTDSSAEQQLERARELLNLVELPSAVLSRYPHELSGGQAQRLAIARALAPEPRLLVLDEAVASLDVSIQARILRLLHRLRQQLKLSYLFISHDLGTVEILCDEIAVMYLGGIVEQAPTAALLGSPKHPYTRALLSAVPVIGQHKRRIELAGEPPSPAHPPSGCVFHPRCYRAERRCASDEPKLSDGPAAHPCACFFADDSEPKQTMASSQG
jgi:oligopeptide/dipeptide ABC transporter ATP-binding protein